MAVLKMTTNWKKYNSYSTLLALQIFFNFRKFRMNVIGFLIESLFIMGIIENMVVFAPFLLSDLANPQSVIYITH